MNKLIDWNIGDRVQCNFNTSEEHYKTFFNEGTIKGTVIDIEPEPHNYILVKYDKPVSKDGNRVVTMQPNEVEPV